jgi:hypothetical protein
MARGGRGTTAFKEREPDDREELVGLAHDFAAHTETGPRLSGGDIDADWVGAYASGEESVGGSVATPDQDVVDDLGRALGVEQESDAPVQTSDEILRARDRLRWHLERNAADAEEGRTRQTLLKKRWPGGAGG